MYKALLKMRSKKGFTLMELLIVVAIIAILAAIAIPTFAGSLKKARDAADVATARSLYAAVSVDFMTQDEDEFAPPPESSTSPVNYPEDSTTNYVFNGDFTIDYEEDEYWSISVGDQTWTLSLNGEVAESSSGSGT